MTTDLHVSRRSTRDSRGPLLVPPRAHLGSYSLYKLPPFCYSNHSCFDRCMVKTSSLGLVFGLSFFSRVWELVCDVCGLLSLCLLCRSAELYFSWNCCMTTIFRRSSMFLDDFDVDDDAELPMSNAWLLMTINITTKVIIYSGRCSLLSYTVTS